MDILRIGDCLTTWSQRYGYAYKIVIAILDDTNEALTMCQGHLETRDRLFDNSFGQDDEYWHLGRINS